MSKERAERNRFSRGTLGLTAVLLAAAGLSSGASAQSIPGEQCAPEVVDGTVFHFEEETGSSISAPFCFATGFRCEPPEENGGPSYQLVDPDCDPTGQDPCAVQVRVPIKFPGNQDNIDDGANLVEVRWFDQSTAPDCADPVQCDQVSTCGKAGAGVPTIDTDRATFTATHDLTCDDIRNGSLPLSLTAWACITSSSCRERLDVNGLDLDGDAVAEEIGCPIPPTDNCAEESSVSCRDCLPGGMGVGGGGAGGGGPGGPGDPAPGRGALLTYAAGGAGFEPLPGATAWRATLGRGWSHSYARRIVAAPDESHVWLITPGAIFREWSDPDPTSGVYRTVSPSNEYRTLTWTGTGWNLEELDGTVHAFDAGGLWLSTTDRNGNVTAATYSSGVLTQVQFPDGRREDFAYSPSGDPSEGKLESITEVGVDASTTRVWTYHWTGDDLTRVDRPDGTAILYGYSDAALPGFMTRVELEGTDGASTRVERGWEYDAEGNAVATWRGDASKTGPDAVEVWELAFDDPSDPTVTTVTDPLGRQITYQLDRDTESSNVKVLSIEGDCPVCGLGPNVELIYEDPSHPLLPTRIIDGRGIWTEFEYDGFGQVGRRIDAGNDPNLARETRWQYHADFRTSPTLVEGPFPLGGVPTREVETTYDPVTGDVDTRTHRGLEATYPTGSFALLTQLDHNAAGEPLTIDPPGHGTDDVTSFTYDPARGDLVPLTRTDPVIGQLGDTTFAYDAFNRRTLVTDPNGVTTETEYDALDRVTAIRQAAGTAEELVTEHDYNTFGDLFRTTLPRDTVIEYDYDAAGRLLSIERKPDASTPGERTLYTLDAAGNRTREELQRWDAGAGAWVTESATAFEYTNRCQVDRVVQAPGEPEEAVTEYAYDCNGNLERLWDPNHPRFPEDPSAPPPPPDADSASLGRRTHEEAPAPIVYGYDALDRLTAVDALWGGEGGGTAVTAYAYDVQDHLVSVTDAEDNLTRYTYSDRDLLTEEVSPVSGTTTHAYDEHGELLTTTDARGVTVTRTVDALDRVTEVSYPDASLDVSYLYDQAPAACAEDFHAGRLAEILRDGSSVVSCYDRFGRVTRDGELTYGYDANGNRTTVGYPGEVVTTYGYDFADRPASLTLQVEPDPAQPIVTAASYLPGGPLASLTLGNGLSETRSFDGRYAPAGIDLSGITALTYSTDPVGNVTRIERSVLDSRFVLGYRYQDVQYFLSEGTGPWGHRSWSYDRIGNRLTEGRGAGGDVDLGSADGVYTYATNPAGGNTPQLLEVAGPLGAAGSNGDESDESLRHAFSYDAAGNQTSIEPMPAGFGEGSSLLGYDDASRLASLGTAFGSEETTVTYDGRGYLAISELTVFGSSDFERTEAVYGSEGLLRAVHRAGERTGSGDGDADDGGGGGDTSSFDETTYLLDFAGRPVAQLTVDALGLAPDRLLWLTPDHLGTPIAATDAAGSAVWQGGLSPFGTPYSFTEEGVAGGDQDPDDGGSDVDDPDEPVADPPPDPPPPGDDGRDDGQDGGGGGGTPCEGPDCDDGRDGGGTGSGDPPCTGPGCDDGRDQPPGSGDDGRDDGGGTGGGGEGCTGPDCDDGRDGGGSGSGDPPCTTDCADGRIATLALQATLAASPEEAGILLRFPGQWHDPTFEAATIPGGIYQNGRRWYQPGTGRYTRADPLGLVNPNAFSPRSAVSSRIEMVYGYAEMNPLMRLDPLGLRSRVCCRLIARGFLGRARHCFFQIERNGKTTTCGLVGGRFSGLPAKTGYIFRDNPFDRVKDPENNCGPWNEDCGTDECVIQRARNYSNPSFYRFARGPNSNSFTGNIARVCGLTRPDVASTPGWNDPPAPPRYIGPQASQQPVGCALP